MFKQTDINLKRSNFIYLAWRHALWHAMGLAKSQVTISTRKGLYTVSTKDSGLSAYLNRHKQYFTNDSVRSTCDEKHLAK